MSPRRLLLATSVMIVSSLTTAASAQKVSPPTAVTTAATTQVTQPATQPTTTNPKSSIVLNLGPFTGGEYPFINTMLTAGGLSSPNGFGFPSVLDTNGYPVSGSLPQDINGVLAIPAAYTDPTTTWVLEWNGNLGTSARPGFQLTLGNGVKEVGSSGCVSGSTSYNLTVFGNNCHIEFTFSAAHPSGFISFKFPAGASLNGSLSKLSLYRKVHQTAYMSGEVFNPDFVAALQNLSPRVIRTLNWTLANLSNVAKSGQMTPGSAFSYGPRWDSRIWVGSATGTNAYAGALAGVTSLADGLTVQVQFATANSSSATFNLNGLGPAPIANLAGAPISMAGAIATNSIWTLIYDASLRMWLGKAGGINAGVPLATQIALANKLGADLWINVPTHATDELVASIATLLRDGLSPGLNAWYEYSNEVWNFNDFSFPQTNWAVARGAALGLPIANGERYNGFYALRSRQVMGNVTSVYGTKRNYKRVLAFQAVGDVPTTQKWRLQGFDLSGATFPQYCTAVGGTPSNGSCAGDPQYNLYPNRPVDFADVLAYATYYSGAQLKNVSANYTNSMTSGGPSGYSVGLLGAADGYSTGASNNVASALAWVDQDLRQGTLNGVAGPATLLAFNSTKNIGVGPVGVYPSWEVVAKAYDSARPNGAPALLVASYEGGMESTVPTSAKCAALGIDPSYCGTGGRIDNLLTAYKKSPLFQQLVTDQINQFLTQPHSKYSAWYELANQDQWSLYQASIYSTPFASVTAIQQLRR